MNKKTKKLIKELESENLALTNKLNEVLKKPMVTISSVGEKIDPKMTILNREAKLCLLEESMKGTSRYIFSFGDKPLEMISFTDWVDKLTREDLIGGLEKNEVTFSIFDEMTLSEIKAYYHEALLMFYNKKKKDHVDLCNGLIAKKKGV